MTTRKKHAHAVLLSGVLAKHPEFAMRYNKDRTKLFVYHMIELQPIVIAEKSGAHWTVNGKRKRDLAHVLETALDIVNVRKAIA